MNILRSDPAWGVDAAYKANGRVVYVQTRVGPVKPDIYRQAWPDDPANEMDMRLVDQEGNTFVLQRGGDRLIDTKWNDEIAAEVQKPLDAVQRAADYQLARQAGTSLRGALSADFKDHAYQVERFASQPVPAEDPVMIGRISELAGRPLPPQAYSTDGSSWNLFVGDVYEACAASIFWSCVGYHASIRLSNCAYNWSSNTSNDVTNSVNGPCNWTQTATACDHGRCWWDSGMGGRIGTTMGGWNNNYNMVDTLNIQSNNASNTGTGDNGGCSTPYAWWTGNWSHNSNDDAAYLLWQVKNGSAAAAPMGRSGMFEAWWSGYHYACDCGGSNCNDSKPPGHGGWAPCP